VPDHDWAAYVAAYHTDHPGITETVFDRARDAELGSPHDWLASGVPGPSGAVLDVACGSAPMHDRLQLDSYLGVDLSTAELALARSRGRGPVGVADARSLPIAAGTVDTVVCSMGLMLVRPVEPAVHEMARVLRPGGRLALLLPGLRPTALRDLRPVLALAVALHGPGSMPQHLGPQRVRRLLLASGFEVDTVTRHRFGFPLRGIADVRLAVSALYTPGRDADQLRAAERRLARYAGPGVEIGVPLVRVVAHRPGAARL